MLFATPLVREQVKLDPRYADAETITNDDLAKIALERRGLRDLELMRHVNAMLGELGDGAIAFRLYNASDERLWLHRDSYTGRRRSRSIHPTTSSIPASGASSSPRVFIPPAVSFSASW